jgi:hypothetical protein
MEAGLVVPQSQLAEQCLVAVFAVKKKVILTFQIARIMTNSSQPDHHNNQCCGSGINTPDPDF